MTRIRITLAALAAAALTLAACGPGYVIVGEDHNTPFDVPPNGRLDLVMYQHTTTEPNGWMAAGTPTQRCDQYGGELAWRNAAGTWLLICEHVDY